MQSQIIYLLKNDIGRVKAIQQASLSKGKSGLKIENNLLFGSAEWFKAIEEGAIKKHAIIGRITRVYMSGHNDFPEFEIESDGKLSTWERMGNEELYIANDAVEIIYVEQKLKSPILNRVHMKCVIEVSILSGVTT